MKSTTIKIVIGLQLALGIMACCSVKQTWLYKPGDTVSVRGTRFNIIRRTATTRPGCFYDVLDINHTRYVNGLAQNGMKPVANQK